ncbi:uncharacterized protein LOC125264360 [Megalobrama amblycephala]|uniref:uncharacterized protein LOC125264360 n=1 Tax=Megalobrama amblycephala TaxID=75352 RepID=UPI0020146520|nr:uncharacterized protein LOC125264360 [Megalobrama amblycephala]XP_048039573.1 uncharacterized protein LOC125264360 [Megalobrama amblycephala]XP_048039574.1 uncharacterized protein LOC125264360 [Megalobrama amblycephala]
MASSGPYRRRNSIDLPPTIADVFRLRDEFIKLYARDHPQLQQCLKKLQEIIKTFEKDFRVSTEGSRTAGWLGIKGGAAVAAGIVGLIAAPFTLGFSVPLAAGVGAAGAAGAAGGSVTLKRAGILSNKSSSEKKDQMDRLRQNIESELKEFQDKISPMAEKMIDIHERTEKIMTDFKNLEKDGSDLTKKLQIEELAELTGQMSESMRLISSIAEIYGGANLVLDMISVNEHGRALNDMDKLAQKPIHEEIDESEIRSKAGKFIVEMRKLINQLQNIINELEKTKHKLAEF